MMENGDQRDSQRTSKRRKLSGRRQAACQTCSLRKVKCDHTRPVCSSCKATGSECSYLNESEGGLTVDHVVQILGAQIHELSEKLDTISNIVQPQVTDRSTRSPHITSPIVNSDGQDYDDSENVEPAPIPSRDFSQIPPGTTTADQVLVWPVFDAQFPENYLIDPHLGYQIATGGTFDGDIEGETTIVPLHNNLAPLDEQRIPYLIDRFLENVHTKNPILDVELLVSKSREYASRGLGWDGYSCLLLMTCALGLVAKPFGSQSEANNLELSIEDAREICAPTGGRQQGDNCFVQACRRLGVLRPSIIAAQCNFFAGVYLMYTLRPMLAWQYFHQASIAYQLYLRMNGRILANKSVSIGHTDEAHPVNSRISRLEQRLYWSCFKSEAEFRVELPLPQSELSEMEFDILFPSPPSPPSLDQPTVQSPVSSHTSMLAFQTGQAWSNSESAQIKSHAKRLCNEEESWYYYLTEVALRRIGNRVINTFFRQDNKNWLNINSFLNVVIEFEAQVSTWQTNLPPAMQKYETNSFIRAPRVASPGGAEAGFVSRELSWATENRLLEMRHWLYQPVLYCLVHTRPHLPAQIARDLNLDPHALASPSTVEGDNHHVFWSLVVRAIDCNLTILDTRTEPHRHHGLWFDMRNIICSTLLLLAIVKSGYQDLIPGGRHTLIGEEIAFAQNAGRRQSLGQRLRVRGKFGRVLRQLEVWSAESPDMVRSVEVLEVLIWSIMSST